MYFKIKNIVLLFVSLVIGLIFISCENTIELDIPESEQFIVVEGSIEQDQKANVLLSLSAPYFSYFDSTIILDYRLTTAKVVMFHKDKEDVFTLKKNTKYFPPYIYQSRIKGEVGEKYKLMVISKGDTLLAETRIPEPVFVDSLWYELKAGSDSSVFLIVQLTDNVYQKNYYRTLSKVLNQDEKFYPTRISVWDDDFFNGKSIELSLDRGVSRVIETGNSRSYKLGDTVVFKLCSIEQSVYDFWNSYQNIIISSANPFSSPNREIKSNISGGIGVFAGYGVTYDTLVIGKYGKKKER